MANLTANLKDNSYKISNYIKDGNKSLTELSSLVDTNVGTIQIEGRRLKVLLYEILSNIIEYFYEML